MYPLNFPFLKCANYHSLEWCPGTVLNQSKHNLFIHRIMIMWFYSDVSGYFSIFLNAYNNFEKKVGIEIDENKCRFSKFHLKA